MSFGFIHEDNCPSMYLQPPDPMGTRYGRCTRRDAAKPPERPAVRVITITEPGYEVVLFFNEEGGAQAMIKRPGDKLPIGMRIAPPEPGRRIVVERVGNTFEILYKDAQP